MEPFADKDKLAVIGAAAAGAAVGAVAGPVGAAVGALVGGTAVCYLKQQQEEQSQHLTHREESRPSVPTPSSFTVPTPCVKAPPVQRITKQFLVLVISATQADFLDSLQAKGRIDMSDGEALYEMTKYLWLGYKTDLSQIKPNINQYSVSKAEESEYDICLVYIELKQTDKGFEPNVNQLDRYDAFRNLADLAGNFEVSPRFRMEAYENIDVYNR